VADHYDRKKKTYDVLLDKCLRSVQRKAQNGFTVTRVRVPPFMFGLPKYDFQECITYLCDALRLRGMQVDAEQDVLLISWSHAHRATDAHDEAKLVTNKSASRLQPEAAANPVAHDPPSSHVIAWNTDEAMPVPENPPLVFPCWKSSRLDTGHMHPDFRKYVAHDAIETHRNVYQQFDASVLVKRATGARDGKYSITFN
jgi:hypothetical protein